MIHRLRSLSLITLIALSIAGCSGTERPDLLLIVVDTFRADHLGCYGYGRETTPAIDFLASQGVVYEAAYTTAPWTLPSFASIVTSTYPWEHGASNDYFAVREEIPTLANELATLGYQSAAFVSHIYTSSRYGFDRGFDHFQEFGIDENYRFDADLEPDAEQVVRAATEWVTSRDRSKPFFLLVHLFDPHWDYGAPEPYRHRFTGGDEKGIDGTYSTIARYMPVDSLMSEDHLRYVEGLYDGEIRYVDSWLDTLFGVLQRDGSWDRCITAVTADHGEEFQDHRSMGHSFTFYDEVIRVPLVLRDPNFPSGKRVQTPVSVIDIFPTFVERAGGSPAPSLSGRPLPFSQDESQSVRTLFAATTREGRHGRAAIRGTEKVVWSASGIELYRRTTDPGEQQDLAGDNPATVAEMDSLVRAAVGNRGWTMEWGAQATESGELSGAIRVSGVVTDVITDPDAVDFLVTGPNSFQFAGKGGSASSLRFIAAPPDCTIEFQIVTGAGENPALIAIGRDQLPPPAVGFALDPSKSPPGHLGRPHDADERRLSIWKYPDHAAPETISLTPAERSQLEAHGYF